MAGRVTTFLVGTELGQNWGKTGRNRYKTGAKLAQIWGVPDGASSGSNRAKSTRYGRPVRATGRENWPVLGPRAISLSARPDLA